jgi:glycosyltransferase involved in cell wall biosynthesis
LARRIAFLTHYTELYGANLSMVNLIEGLKAYGVQAHVICPDEGDLIPALAARGVPVAWLPFEWWVSSQPSVTGAVRRMLTNVGHLRPIVAQLKAWKIDLVYSNSSVFSIGALAAWRLGLPHVWHLREFGNRDYDLWLDWGLPISRRIYNSANQTIFVSHALRQAFLGDTHPANSQVIYNGVASAEVFEARRAQAETLRGRVQPLTFVLVGRFRASKGQDVAIRAFADASRIHPNMRLLLVGGAGNTGDQGYFEQCQSLVSTLNLTDKVTFWGYIPDPERAFLAADVALMCSRNEAMGRVTVEAMSACRPVIGFDSAGTSELIDHGQTGLLYQKEEAGLTAAMLHYANHPEDVTRHGDAAWASAVKRHTTEVYAEQIHDVLRKIESLI